MAGTLKHSALKAEVDNLKNPNLKTEQSYNNGVEVPYGASGSVRFDVVLVDQFGRPIYAWDFKTGSALLSASIMAYMQSVSGFHIPVIELR